MKKLFLVILALLFLSPMAFAASTTGTFGDQNSSKAYRVSVDTDGTVTYAADTSIEYPYSNVTSATIAQTLTATDSGRVIADAAVTYGHKFTLPRAAPGLVYTIIVSNKVSTTIDTVDTSDTINYSISGTLLDAGDSIKSTAQAGDSVTLCSTLANEWEVCSMHGIWTDNSTN